MAKADLWMTLGLAAIGCLGIGAYRKWTPSGTSAISHASENLTIIDSSEHILPKVESTEVAILAKPLTGSKVVKYQPSNEIIANPERGFFWQRFTLENNPVTVEDLRMAREQHYVTTIRGVYDIRGYRDRPFPQSVLDQFDRDCEIYRQAGSKVMPLFFYSKDFIDRQSSDAKLEIITQQINQLKPLIEKNKDVIAVWYAGFVGPYGEWWGSEHMSPDSKSINQNSRKILTQLLTVVPKERAVMLRRLHFKRQFLADSQPLIPSEAFKGTPKSRLGHHNDSLVANPTEGQAMSIIPAERKIEETYLNQDNRFVPAVGETEYFGKGESSRCSRSVGIIGSRRYSLINKLFNLKTLNQWKQEGCFDEIEKKLGYRFVAIQSEMPQSIAKSAKIPLRLTLQNQGWASPFNRRAIEIVFKNKSSGKVSKFDVSSQADPRLWLPEKGKFAIDFQIAHKLAPGSYSVYLNLPDPMPKLKNRPEYSIQLANAKIWNPQTGYNSLDRSIEIR